jgi:hypothetical protein
MLRLLIDKIANLNYFKKEIKENKGNALSLLELAVPQAQARPHQYKSCGWGP